MKHETLDEERRRLAAEIRLQKRLMKAKNSPKEVRSFLQSRVCNEARREARVAHLAHNFLMDKNLRKKVEGNRQRMSDSNENLLCALVGLKVYQTMVQYPRARVMAKYQYTHPTLNSVRMLVNHWMLT